MRRRAIAAFRPAGVVSITALVCFDEGVALRDRAWISEALRVAGVTRGEESRARFGAAFFGDRVDTARSLVRRSRVPIAHIARDLGIEPESLRRQGPPREADSIGRRNIRSRGVAIGKPKPEVEN